MTYQPITATEARGDSPAMRRACLDSLSRRGLTLLQSVKHDAKRSDALSLDQIQEAYDHTRAAWDGVTIDLGAMQTVRRSTGYAVSTGGDVHTGYHRDLPEGASLPEFLEAICEVARHTPDGQYLGVFHDSELPRIDIDTVYLTESRDDAIAVGVAAHSTGGAYDFATGSALWIPHLEG